MSLFNGIKSKSLNEKPELTFPRKMIVINGDLLNGGYVNMTIGTVIAYIDGKEYPWIVEDIDNPNKYIGYQYADEIKNKP
jgi:hypothetical protein